MPTMFCHHMGWAAPVNHFLVVDPVFQNLLEEKFAVELAILCCVDHVCH